MFQRLIAIPQEEYLQMKSIQQIQQPMTQQFCQLENQYEVQNESTFDTSI